MTQSELQDVASERLDIGLIATKNKYCTFDAYSDDYVVELKCRRTHYDTQLIEYKKFSVNIDQADESGKEFLYIISTPSGDYIFNISKLYEDDYDFGWEYRSMPSNTDFSNKGNINKKVGYIDVMDAY